MAPAYAWEGDGFLNGNAEIVVSNDGLKLGAYVITFRRPEILRKTLTAILGQTRPPDDILIVDNGDSEDTRAVAEEFGVGYHTFLENKGPAGASEYAIQRFADQGFDWIYWGDDDDPPKSPGLFERILRHAKAAPADVAGFGEVGARFSWRTGEIYRIPDSELKTGLVDCDYIGGGQQFFLRAEVARTVGVPNGALFFGGYEPEYCLRVRRAGYRFQVDGEMMYQARVQAGRLNLGSTRKLTPRYSKQLLWRRYYRTRNYTFYTLHVFRRPDLTLIGTLKSLARCLFSIAKGPKYAANFTLCELRGLRDGCLQNLGRTVSPSVKEVDSPCK